VCSLTRPAPSRRGALLAPDPAKPGWFAKPPARKAADAKADAVADKAGARKVAAALVTPPPPDAPGPKGGMLDFLEGLKKKVEPSNGKAPAAASPAPAAPAPGGRPGSPPPVAGHRPGTLHTRRTPARHRRR
jgi:hypothetical protein